MDARAHRAQPTPNAARAALRALQVLAFAQRCEPARAHADEAEEADKENGGDANAPAALSVETPADKGDAAEQVRGRALRGRAPRQPASRWRATPSAPAHARARPVRPPRLATDAGAVRAAPWVRRSARRDCRQVLKVLTALHAANGTLGQQLEAAEHARRMAAEHARIRHLESISMLSPTAHPRV